jgi:hypothetical protein
MAIDLGIVNGKKRHRLRSPRSAMSAARSAACIGLPDRQRWGRTDSDQPVRLPWRGRPGFLASSSGPDGAAISLRRYLASSSMARTARLSRFVFRPGPRGRRGYLASSSMARTTGFLASSSMARTVGFLASSSKARTAGYRGGQGLSETGRAVRLARSVDPIDGEAIPVVKVRPRLAALVPTGFAPAI